MAVTINDLQKVRIDIAVTDAEGNPAAIEGSPQWAIDNVEVATLELAEGGLSAEVISTGALGQATLTVSADADLGEGIKTIQGDLLIDVVASEATGVTLTAGEPELR